MFYLLDHDYQTLLEEKPDRCNEQTDKILALDICFLDTLTVDVLIRAQFQVSVV
jgi:hypothetical protein